MDASPSRYSDSARPLEQFRATPRRLPLHPLENALLWIAAAHLIFLPWTLGAMSWWSQAVSLALAVIGFAVALIPRNYSEELTTGAGFRLVTWPRLVRFPIFWAGLLLLAYIVVQGLNPAWTYMSNDRGWWMQQRSHTTWLPSGVDGRFFFGGGPWRTLIIYASAWLVVCSLRIGFTRRRTVQFLLIALAANGFALAIVGLIQRLGGARKIFWLFPSKNPAFFASFIYKNHAGAYFLLMLILGIGFAAWFYLRGLRRMEKSNPAGVFVFFSVLIAVDIMISYARGATITMVAFLAIATVALLVFQWRHRALIHSPLATILLLAAFLTFLGISFQALSGSAQQAQARFERLFEEGDTSVSSRELATAATWDMAKDHLLFGAGAGSFRYLFPLYQQHHPEIYKIGRERLLWENAHNDFVQFPAELGLIGVAVMAFCGFYWLFKLVRVFFWENPFSLLVVIGALLIVAHSWTDFLFENPAILITWCAFWPCITLWTESEELRLRS